MRRKKVAEADGSYFDQLQTCVCQLDPKRMYDWADQLLMPVHTAAYTRAQSSILFTAVVAVSSKFFRPEVYEQALAMAERLVGQAMSECVSTIEVVQAICLLHCGSCEEAKLTHRLEEAY